MALRPSNRTPKASRQPLPHRQLQLTYWRCPRAPRDRGKHGSRVAYRFQLLPSRRCYDCDHAKRAVPTPLTSERVHRKRLRRQLRPRHGFGADGKDGPFDAMTDEVLAKELFGPMPCVSSSSMPPSAGAGAWRRSMRSARLTAGSSATWKNWLPTRLKSRGPVRWPGSRRIPRYSGTPWAASTTPTSSRGWTTPNASRKVPRPDPKTG